MLKKLTATLLLSLSAIMPNAALANEIEDHQYLWETIGNIGVTRYINHPDWCPKTEEYNGMYDAGNNILVVCQDNITRPTVKMIPWTDNDLDTLRLEARHIVQDCASSTLADSRMDNMFDRDELIKFIAQSGLTQEKLRWIAQSYSEQGADEEMIIIEFEAFAVAESIGARLIAEKLIQFCGLA